MTGRAAPERPGGEARDDSPDDSGRLIVEGWNRSRPALAAAAAVLLVTALVPPLSSDARHIEALEALQFALLALGVPVLVVLAAPWPHRSAVGRLAEARRRHPDSARSVVYLILEAGVVVAWRIPASVDALARHGWLAPVEAVTLVGPGIGLWLELVESAPFRPRLPRPKRMAVAAVAMWTIWVTAYLVGLSHTSVYRAYAHIPGADLSVPADQAVATGVLWCTSLCAFVPVIFSNLMVWLRGDEDPDQALHRLVGAERRRTTPSPAGGDPTGASVPGEAGGTSGPL